MTTSLHVAADIPPVNNGSGVGATIAGLTNALNSRGDGARILVPGFPDIMTAVEAIEPVLEMTDLAGQGPATLLSGRLNGLAGDVYIVRCDGLYDREGSSDDKPDGSAWADNWCRFGALGLIAAGLAQGADAAWSPDILQIHDWHAGLAAAYIRAGDEQAAKVITTVHNVDRQGLFAAPRAIQLGVPEGMMAHDGMEFHGRMSFLKAGLAFSDWITTVSPTYAEEIQTPHFGAGLEGLFSHRAVNSIGIVNGLNEVLPGRPLEAGERDAAKTSLLEDLDLSTDTDGPLMVMVGDLTRRSGADLVVGALPAILERGIRFCVSGHGETRLEDDFRELAAGYSDRIAACVGDNPDLEARLVAAADLILVPSRVEPSGQNQLQAMKHGTVPLVRRTGGLADTVVNAEPNHLNAGRATGFSFIDETPSALLGTMHWACDTWEDQFVWQQLREAGMRQDFTWSRAALLYSRLYNKVVKEVTAMAG